ncbi:MAG: DF family (seleno)protein [Candidatus Acidiferrales bacterium]
MKVEILYVAECPSHSVAVKLVKDVLAAQGVAAVVDEVLVTDERMADELRFCGSPTIRINGRDVACDSPKDHAFALSCRLYAGSEQIGLPPAEMIRRAVVEARGASEK